MKPLSKEQLHYEYWDLNQSIVDIGKKYECSFQYISTLMKKYGVPNNRSLSLIDLSNEQKALVVGSMLGDTYVPENKQGKGRFCLGHSLKQKKYLIWKSDFMNPFMTRSGIKTKFVKDNRPNHHDCWKCITWSYVHPFFTKMLEFYDENRIKFINKDLLNQYFNVISLAVWFMDDGSCKNQRFYNFATASFKYKELLELQKIIKKNVDLNIFPYKNGKYFYMKLDIKENIKLENMIRPYIIPSMSYKLINRLNSVETKSDLSALADKVIVRPCEQSQEVDRNILPVGFNNQ